MNNESFELPDIGLTTCTVLVPGIDERCGAPANITDVTRENELRLTIECDLGHEVSGSLSELFEPMDLARPAIFSLESNEFRELEAIVKRYREYVKTTSAVGPVPDTSSFDIELHEWAAGQGVSGIPFEVWLVLRDRWDEVDKPVHPDRTWLGKWVPDDFILGDWS